VSDAVAFLLDEHLSPTVQNAIRGVEPNIKVRLIGVDTDVPPKGTLDPEVLMFAEANRFTLVTFDKRTMPGHVSVHNISGRHTWGVLIFPNGRKLSPGFIAKELIMVWGTSQPDDWIDRIENLAKKVGTQY
jgi:hypothetical protein